MFIKMTKATNVRQKCIEQHKKNPLTNTVLYTTIELPRNKLEGKFESEFQTALVFLAQKIINANLLS